MNVGKAMIIGYFMAGILIGSKSAIAAESITFKYRMFRSSISVKELKTFSKTGELSSSLEFYVKRSKTKPEHLQKALNTPITLNGILAYRFLNSSPGEMMLDQMKIIIKTPSGKANRESLRGAIVSSALEDNQVRLIEVIENYPTSEVIVEGNQIIELHNRLDGIMDRLSYKSKIHAVKNSLTI